MLLPTRINYQFHQTAGAAETEINHTTTSLADIFAEDNRAASAQIGGSDALMVGGTMHIKTKQIVIEDTLDKCTDHEYCPWGFLSVWQGEQKAVLTCSQIETGIAHKYDIQRFTQYFPIEQRSTGFGNVDSVLATTAQYYRQGDKREYTEYLTLEQITLTERESKSGEG